MDGSFMNKYPASTGLKGSILLLFSRLLLFAVFQVLIALFLSSIIESEKYWLLSATLTNIVSIAILIILLKRDGIKYFSLFRFSKQNRLTDFLIFLGLLLISMPVILIPSLSLSNLFWGNTTYYHQVLFQTIPKCLIYFLLVVFPVSVVFAELPMYFGYIMPKLKNHVKYNWSIFLLPVLFLSLQDCTLPMVFELKFIIFRGIMYLPFSFMLGFALFKRPSLLPYMSILEGIIYTLPVIMQLTEEYKNG
jgi:hypothetical protein